MIRSLDSIQFVVWLLISSVSVSGNSQQPAIADKARYMS